MTVVNVGTGANTGNGDTLRGAFQAVNAKFDALDAQALYNAALYSNEGDWLTATAYAVNDLVTQSSIVYVCQIAHTSGTFATDLAAGRWTVHQGVTAAELLDDAGAGMVGYSALVAYQAGTVGYQLLGRFRLISLVPSAERADILAGVSDYDVTTLINQAFTLAKRVIVDAGGWYTRRTINMTARGESDGSFDGRILEGEGEATTVINAYTGDYPILDLTGANYCTVKGINFRSDNASYAAGLTAADCASVGIVNRRGDSGGQAGSCSGNRYDDLRLQMHSDMTRNGGVGTIGFINIGGEHLVSNGRVQIYANMPVVIQNSLTGITLDNSSDMPTYGGEYEDPYSGSAISCTIMYFPSWQLISLDTFRHIWCEQVAEVRFPNLYTSTRYRSDLTPSFSEAFLLRDCAGVTIEAYSESSGLFGSTWRMDHRFLTIGGVNSKLDVRVQRGVADYGFSDPGVSASSVHLEDGAYINDSAINCACTEGNYNDSAGNLGLATMPVTFSGTPNAIKNTTFTLDGGLHLADIFDTLGPYCTNVESINYLNGDTYLGNGKPVSWAPVVVGRSTAGTATTTFAAGTVCKTGRTWHVTATIVVTGHTGTGGIQITGLPFTSDEDLEQRIGVAHSSLGGASGKTIVGIVPIGSSVINLIACDPAGGAQADVAIDTSFTVILTGVIKAAG